MQNNPSSLWSVGGIDARTGFKPANDSTSIPHQKEKPSKAEQKQNAIDAYAEKTYFEVLKDIECLQSGTDRTKTLYAKASKLFQAQAAGQLVGFNLEYEITEAAIKSGLKPSEIKSTLTQVEKISSTAQAIILSGSTYTPDPVKFFDLIDGTTMAAQAKAPNYLIEYMLEDNAHGFLAGSSGAFKSFIALEMGHCIASGRPFLGNKVMKKGKVIYICGEGKGGIKRRLRAIDNKYGESSNIMIINKDIALNEKGMIDALSSLFSKVEPVLVIYDTLNSLSGGIENNSSGDTSALYKALASASNVCSASTMIVHHYGKDKTKGMEGSHTFRSNTDYVFTADRSDDKLLVTRLGNMKQKDGEEFQPILIELEEVGLGFNDHNDKPCHSLRVVGKAPDNLVMRASPEKITAKSETLRAIKCLHAEQAKAAGNLKVIVSPKDIKSWMECHSEKKYNQKYIGELEHNGDIIQKGNGYIPK